MNVQLIMETVNSCVIIALEVTGAPVLLDTNWILIIETAQVEMIFEYSFKYKI